MHVYAYITSYINLNINISIKMTLSFAVRPCRRNRRARKEPAGRSAFAGDGKRGRDAHEHRELGELSRRALTGERNEKARARCADGGDRKSVV